jgi:hypothetical protein
MSFCEAAFRRFLPCVLLQVASAGALSIAFEHPAITGNLRTVCSLLQTCKAWQAVLQQCSAGHLSINPMTCLSLHKLSGLSCFAAWLPKHSGLVGELHVCHLLGSMFRRTADECVAAEQILALSIQHAANRAAAPEAAPLLRLRSVTLTSLRSAALLQALPAAALTKLVVRYSQMDWAVHLSLNSCNVTQGLQRLTNVQELHLTASKQLGSWVQDACLAAVGQLTQLTQLQMCCVAAGSNLSLLPHQLCNLELRVCCSSSITPSGSSTAVALGHLSALRQLELYVYGDPGLGSSLPTGLTGLTVAGVRDREDSDSYSNLQHVSLIPLQQLQQLWLSNAAVDIQQLQSLATVSTLTHIAIRHENMLHASSQAPAWRHLPALKALYLSPRCMVGIDMQEPHAHQLDQAASLALLECLAAATNLTRLELSGAGEEEPPHAWCGYLTSLQQLRCLTLFQQQVFDREDLLQLTALTNLWALRIVGVAAFDDAAAVALAMRLTNLRSLERVGLTSAAALPAIAALTGLTKLSLSAVSEMQEQLGHADLKLLTALTRLREFEPDTLFDEEAVWDLWDDEGRMWLEQQQA